MTTNEFRKILDSHQNWLDNNGGTRADLSGKDLRGTCLGGVDLRKAYLSCANLQSVSLCGANLEGAILRRTNLSGADLTLANLRGADLFNANLRGAILREANLANAQGLVFLATPPEAGAFIAFKKVSSGVAKIEILASAKRTGSYIGRKCRASAARVISAPAGAYSSYAGRSFKYVRGKIVRPDRYVGDPRIECSHGIHFFMTRQEAEEY